ncbi:hypothetical protein [Streptomyces sp. NPDC048357]|uniref:hypothetical protein n=1 Tax=Streptomyces sp. NPDC048357 TaxID=3154719 RepID=UPI0034441080
MTARTPGGPVRGETLRNRGEPSGFASLGATVRAAAMRRAQHRDLAVLKALLER